MSLHETSGDDDALAFPRFLHPHRSANLRQRLFFRCLKESTRVDDDGIRARMVGRYGQPILGQQPEHPLRIDQILGTTQAYEGHCSDFFLATAGHQSSSNITRSPSRYRIEDSTTSYRPSRFMHSCAT